MSNFINAFRRHRCNVNQVSATISNTDSKTGFVKVDTNRCFWDHFVSPYKLMVNWFKGTTRSVTHHVMSLHSFTLLELIVVLVILGFLAAMMAKVFTHGDNQKRFDETRIKMEEIKKALLGTSGAYANGQRQFAGYITDMGGLPELIDVDGTGNLQPVDLWEQGSQDVWKYDQGARIWIGWRGPYIETPQNDLLEDAWGDTFSFDIRDTGIDIISRGADGKSGGTSFNEDITLTIRKTQYRAPVAGKVGKKCTDDIVIWFPFNGRADSEVILWDSIKDDSYFRFEDDVKGDSGVPVGVRSIVITEGSDSDTKVFTIEPTGNWLGTLEIGN